MQISYDADKRRWTLEHRGLDFEDGVLVFGGTTFDVLDDRRDYGEVRWQTFGLLNDRLVTLIWTERGAGRHIISMRKCNERETRKYQGQLA